MMGKLGGGAPRKRRKLKVPDAFARLTEEEADKRLDADDVNRVALADAEANGIVFLDEIDKIASRSDVIATAVPSSPAASASVTVTVAGPAMSLTQRRIG